jgi:hypothetical protein
VVAGPEIVRVRLTSVAYAHGLTLALPEQVAMAPDRSQARQIQQGIISHYFDALCFPEWEPQTNRVTYRLYRR